MYPQLGSDSRHRNMESGIRGVECNTNLSSGGDTQFITYHDLVLFSSTLIKRRSFENRHFLLIWMVKHRSDSLSLSSYVCTPHIIINPPPPPPNAAYMRQWKVSLVQIMACRLFGVKPLSEPMLNYHQLDPWVQTSVKLIKIRKFIHESASENIVCEMAAILFRGRWVEQNRLQYTESQFNSIRFRCTLYFCDFMISYYIFKCYIYPYCQDCFMRNGAIIR